ncbi:MAG: hypothetical protein P4L90_02255 [Rhodopila sp.]|nr:hypothetical protein [Rhodopila sp.]
MAPDVEDTVMRKVAWRLIPFLSLGYLINALDRFNVSIAALTMNKELGLSATTYSLAAIRPQPFVRGWPEPRRTSRRQA